MKTYKLSTDKIAEVKGEFKTLYSNGRFIYVQPLEDIELNEPFIQEDLPKEYEEKRQEILSYERVKKTSELNRICDKYLQNFQSSALGSAYIYDMAQEDQINLMGLLIAGIDSFFRCAKASDPDDKQNIPHTKEQLKQVYSDGLKAKSGIIYICGVLKEYVKSLDDLDSIKRVKWEDYEDITRQEER
ncbi:hypothetical protein [Helicobacter sp. 13S00477-4]|uniref:hypothetical protein n=1 Tax=Helicobacter sp. 13S00477-4 TaxID=1905759 RepID=UPI000BA56298|nr:hypothetical protein [Helicobacter sp. 13S00477-4]PAF50853.1 hypothetical protein BKH44_06810 [Helicobacter sp. 13S00477-4]